MPGRQPITSVSGRSAAQAGSVARSACVPTAARRQSTPGAAPLRRGDAILGPVGGRPLVTPGASGSRGANHAISTQDEFVRFRTKFGIRIKNHNAAGTAALFARCVSLGGRVGGRLWGKPVAAFAASPPRSQRPQARRATRQPGWSQSNFVAERLAETVNHPRWPELGIQVQAASSLRLRSTRIAEASLREAWMRFRHFLSFILAAAASVPLGASAADSIKIGFPIPLSGPTAVYGEPILKGAEMAVAEINAKGGVLGRKLELLSRDSKANADEAVRLVARADHQGQRRLPGRHPDLGRGAGGVDGRQGKQDRLHRADLEEHDPHRREAHPSLHLPRRLQHRRRGHGGGLADGEMEGRQDRRDDRARLCLWPRLRSPPSSPA